MLNVSAPAYEGGFRMLGNNVIDDVHSLKGLLYTFLDMYGRIFMHSKVLTNIRYPLCWLPQTTRNLGVKRMVCYLTEYIDRLTARKTIPTSDMQCSLHPQFGTSPADTTKPSAQICDRGLGSQSAPTASCMIWAGS